MNSYKIKSIAAAIAFALGGLSLNASAEDFGPEASGGAGGQNTLNNGSSSSCNYEGRVIRVSAYLEGNNSYVYWRESALDNDYYYARIYDSQILNAAMHAMNGPMQVRIRTDESCHSGRNKGFATRIQLNP